jgi:hypothetical protein
MNYAQAAALIDKAQRHGELFGDGATDEEATQTYRNLAKAVHPDRADEWNRLQAEALFAKLGNLWAERSGKGSADGRFTISTRRRTYAASASIFRSEIAVTYPCKWMDGDDEHEGMMKMPISPRDSDLMQAEAEALKKLHEGDEKYHPFVPQLVESFRHRDKASKAERRVNVTEGRSHGWYSLDLVKKAYPRGLDNRDVAWMWRRMLTVLGFVHQCDLVHGAVLPENVLIHPEWHGLMLINWCYSVPMKTTVAAIVPQHRDLYPSEVLEKRPATQATDIATAARTMSSLLNENAPRQIHAFVRGCTLASEAMRPHDAWELLEEYDNLIERLYGARKFRPFSMPSNWETK